MSEICGIIRFDGADVCREEIGRMFESMQCRESEAEGVWLDCNVGFGSRLFWTTPQSLYENQPLKSSDTRLVVVADARIDNREELLRELEITVADSDTIPDSEIILESYRKWGSHCPQFLMGDFAFVVWDSEKKSAFLARDRMGIKQLYYHRDGSLLLFGSSIDPLFASSRLARTLNREGMQRYVQHLALNRDETFYEKVHRLPSSSCIEFSKDAFVLDRYWFPEHIKIDHSISYKEAVEGFGRHLREAVESCMRSCYPIGLEVSGGLDSSSIFCLVQEAGSKQEIFPYTLQYSFKECDESLYVDALVEKYRIDIDRKKVDEIDYGRYDLDYLLDEVPHWPQRGSSIEYLVQNDQIKKQGIRVVLTGIGGDETADRSDSYLPEYLKKGFIRTIHKEFKCSHTPFRRQLKFYLSQLFPTLFGLLRQKNHDTNNDANEAPILNYPTLKNVHLEEPADRIEIKSEYIAEMMETFLSCETSYWIDMNTMQISDRYCFEVRNPFLDTRLIEYSLRIPPEHLSHCGSNRGLLREVMKEMLPSAILQRRDKGEASANLAAQVKKMDMAHLYDCKKLVEMNILDPRDVEMLRSHYIHLDDSFDKGKVLYYLAYLNLENWIRRNGDTQQKEIL